MTMSRLIWGVTVSLSVTSTLVSQARPTSANKGKGLVNCVHKLCPATLHNAAQSCYSILSHDTLHHHLSSSNGLENGNRELGQLFCFYWGCKNTSTTSQWYFKSVLFEIWLHHLANCIPVGQDLNTHSSPDPSLLLWKWFWLARLQAHHQGPTQLKLTV